MEKKKPKVSASHKLMDYLARRNHSELELREKLRRVYPAEEVQRAIDYAKEQNWMQPPEELSGQVASRLHEKRKGFLYISHYLQKKGLPPVDKDPQLEYNKALELIENRIVSGAEDLPRLMRQLSHRGFDSETIRRVTGQLRTNG